MTTLEFITEVFKQFWSGLSSMFVGFFKGLIELLNFSKYADLISKYTGANGFFSWVLVIVLFIVMFLAIVAIEVVVVSLIKKLLRLTKKFNNNAGGNSSGGGSGSGGQSGNQNPNADTGPLIRFNKLLEVDYNNKDKTPEVLNTSFTLEQVCTNFRHFAASKLELYYTEEVIRAFISSLASSRLVILQGISGTGKTSLPYAFGKFLSNDAFIQPVQPSWRDRSEMLGFFNEFTKKYNEPEFLKRLYEAHYSDNVHITILDELNIARVEYYFAEFLSIMEIPRKEEWKVELVSKPDSYDPKLLKHGKMLLPANMWYIGTANNDESTFSISDKVYDRAMVIDINKKYEYFDSVETESMPLDHIALEDLFNEAKKSYEISGENLSKINQLDDYIMENFKVTFGNRIISQFNSFVPVYVDCGGTEIDGIDYLIATKVLRKFSSLNSSYLRREVQGLIDKMDELFGEDNFKYCKEYLSTFHKFS